MKKLVLSEVLWAALLMLFGVLLPLLFHLLGNASVFLPMHIPIMIGGFILSWPYALAVAILTPLLNCIFTGMPGPIYLLYMIPELVAYTLIINILFRKNEKAPFVKKVYLTLGISIIIGRMISSLFQAIFIANNQDMISFFAASLITGLPGIMLQLLLIPAILYLFYRFGFIKKRNSIAY